MGVSSSKQSKCICVGLDNSGKSTIINYLKATKEKKNDITATIAYSPESFKYGKIQFSVYDMAGQGRYRNLWENFYSSIQCIIFVIDTADTVRLCVVKDELEVLLASPAIASRNSSSSSQYNADTANNNNNKDKSSSSAIPILFFANKMDLPKALTPAQISEVLELDKYEAFPWQIVASNGITGQGVEEGIKWLSQYIK